MLTGELPLGRFALPSQKVQVDVRLDEVVLRALEKEPERRYQHASDVKQAVETIAHTGPQQEHPAASSESKPPKDAKTEQLERLNKPLAWLLGRMRPEHQETIAEQTAHVVSRIAMAILLPVFVVSGLLGSLPELYALLGTFTCIMIAGLSEGLAYLTSPTFAVHKRLYAALTIISDDGRDQTLATVAKDAAEVKANGVVKRALTEMRNQTLRDETACVCALTLAKLVSAASAMQIAIMIQDKTRRETVLRQVALEKEPERQYQHGVLSIVVDEDFIRRRPLP